MFNAKWHILQNENLIKWYEYKSWFLLDREIIKLYGLFKIRIFYSDILFWIQDKMWPTWCCLSSVSNTINSYIFFIHLMQFISELCLFMLHHQRRLWRVFAFKQFGTVFPARNSYCIYVSVLLVYALYLYWSSLCFFFQWFCCTIASVFALITNVYSYQTSILVKYVLL